MSKDWVQLATTADKTGDICGFCHEPNDFADDLGWFYISPSKDKQDIPCCKKCWDGSPGKLHRGIYGLGER